MRNIDVFGRKVGDLKWLPKDDVQRLLAMYAERKPGSANQENRHDAHATNVALTSCSNGKIVLVQTPWQRLNG